MTNLVLPKYALSIMQPWATIITLGYKDVENRVWYTNFRGPFLIHASKAFDDEGFDWVKTRFPEIKLPLKKEFLRGGIIGMSEVIDCVDQSTSLWFTGPYGFVLSSSKQFEEFIPMRGQLRFFNVSN